MTRALTIHVINKREVHVLFSGARPLKGLYTIINSKSLLIVQLATDIDENFNVQSDDLKP